MRVHPITKLLLLFALLASELTPIHRLYAGAGCSPGAEDPNCCKLCGPFTVLTMGRRSGCGYYNGCSWTYCSSIAYWNGCTAADGQFNDQCHVGWYCWQI